MLLNREENPGPAEKAESEKSAGERLAALRKGFAHPEDFSRALTELGMTETDVNRVFLTFNAGSAEFAAAAGSVSPDREEPGR